jgi:serine/threonine-protein kinase HipA
MSDMPYVPQDTQYLWWLSNPFTPVLIGALKLVDGNRRVSLTYSADWQVQGFPLSEDLPLNDKESLPLKKDSAAGAVDDAKPDQWGQRIIQQVINPSRLSLLEYLYFAGDHRTGAFGVSRSRGHYEPCTSNPLPTYSDLNNMEQAIRLVMDKHSVSESQKRLIRPGAALGGAGPKSMISMDGEEWIVKFAEDPAVDTPQIEHASLALARTCGIYTAETRVLSIEQGHALAVRRFDRESTRRLHVISAKVALQAAGESFGYPELSQQLCRLTDASQVKHQQEQLFRRMVFNILIGNTDDHEKNHALIRQKIGHYLLSPAYDVLPTAQGVYYQQMRVGKDGSTSTLDNALSESYQFGLTTKAAHLIANDLSRKIANWREFFVEFGVKSNEIEYLEPNLNGRHLKGQRGTI